MKRIILLIFPILFTIQVNAQLKAKLASNHFDNLAYVKAAPIYDELADKFIQKNTGKQKYILRAAISNGKIYNYEQSVAYYKKLMELDMKAISDRNYMAYIDELRVLKRYKESQSVATTALKIYPENGYFKLISKKGSQLDKIESRGKYNKVELMAFNSSLGDFAPVQYGDSLIFATRAFHRGFLSGRYAWDGENFTKLAYTYKEDGEWKKPKTLGGEFSSRKHDGPVTFSPDGKTMILTQDIGKNEVEKKSMHHLALYFSTKNTEGEWSPLKKFLYAPTSSNNGHACFSPDGKRIYFVSDREGSKGGTDIYYSDFSNGSWQEPINFKEINTEGNEMFPFVSQNNHLYFASDGLLGLGGLDIYFVSLANPEGEPTNMGNGINTSADDFGLIVDKNDRFKGYFTSNRDGLVDQIYSWASKVPSVQVKISVLAQFATPEPVANQKIQLIDVQSGDTTTLTTSEDGSITTGLENGKAYVLLTKKGNFELEKAISFNTNNLTGDTTLNYTLHLNPLFASTRILVFNKKTNDPIKNALVTLYDANTKKDTTMKTDENGYVRSKVNRNSAFKLSANKDGYIGNSSVFTTSKTDDEVEMKMGLVKIEKGVVFKVDNIYYDLNSSVLRPESKVSLDTLAQFIKKNKVKIELSAHTDSRGSNKYNMWLSQKRAQSCVNYLVKEKGISSSMIIAKGYGETRPVNGCVDGVNCSDKEYQANRRTEVKILEVQKK